MHHHRTQQRIELKKYHDWVRGIYLILFGLALFGALAGISYWWLLLLASMLRIGDWSQLPPRSLHGLDLSARYQAGNDLFFSFFGWSGLGVFRSVPWRMETDSKVAQVETAQQMFKQYFDWAYVLSVFALILILAGYGSTRIGQLSIVQFFLNYTLVLVAQIMAFKLLQATRKK
ncbi:hypothetical protein HA052_26675 [Chromobacterium haemolyticum]|uniref:Uncharacterized protein n=1 Tax=Chromobacterium fluminis TaxID=3044269 RepID=A0ABX0LNT8_9NEIS|nr:hypothetical protein [Chromobacterium haemolyticum]NHR08777.1 hypothetical protein [Chromobacterium haemolyticum]